MCGVEPCVGGLCIDGKHAGLFLSTVGARSRGRAWPSLLTVPRCALGGQVDRSTGVLVTAFPLSPSVSQKGDFPPPLHFGLFWVGRQT